MTGFIISILVIVVGIIHTVCHGRSTKRALNALQILTIYLFFSGIFFFLPLCYGNSDYNNKITATLMAIINSVQMFLANGDFNLVKMALEGKNEVFATCCQIYASLLYIVAPALTFTGVLSLFKNVLGEWRLRVHGKNEKVYIMSALNAMSLSLAKSIREKEGSRKSLIVFTDVFTQNEESDYELLTEARDHKAILLKRDIAHLDISEKRNVEIFLIGESEAENVSQAVKIVNKLNAEKNYNKNIKIFVFSHSESTGVILDSIDYDTLLAESVADKNTRDAALGVVSGEKENDNVLLSEGFKHQDFKFKLRRVDEKMQLAWRTVRDMNIFEKAENGEISVLIAGLGAYGMEFFKTLLWFCQLDGFKVKITVVDKNTNGPDGRRDALSVVNHYCPDLLKYNRCDTDGEAQYDIEFVSGIDMQNSGFEELLFYKGDSDEKRRLSQRLQGTDIAIVSLGDDDLNIETAISLRQMFDRKSSFKASKNTQLCDENVQIYAIVYDEQKSGVLHWNDNDKKAAFLRNCKNEPYHIHFIGSMTDQFKYDHIYNEKTERDAYEHHRSWVYVGRTIFEELEKKKKEINASDMCPEKKAEEIEKINKKCIGGDEDFLISQCTPEIETKELLKYEKYEYFRLSSIAKQLHKEAVEKHLGKEVECEMKDAPKSCLCTGCTRRKKSEHMRWNAYMRCMGYSYKNHIKADRAKLHKDLVAWDKLTPFDKLKD